VRKSHSEHRPDPLPGIVRVTRQEAAKGQLHSAILLWFHEGDVASIHTLTVAAQGILSVLKKEAGVRFGAADWIQAQPKSFQEKIRNPQNFFKHGHHKQLYKDVISYAPELPEVFMLDSTVTYSHLFHRLTPTMLLFLLRFSIEQPKAFRSTESIHAKLVDGVKIEDFRGLGRREFYERLLPLVKPDG
jgi:hypothetical protein